ncbi:MAG TPA: PAS domain S-box protein [Polyangia bacterium]
MATFQDDGQRRLDERLRVLSEATRSFAEDTNDYNRLLDTIARALTESVSDVSVLFVVSEDGRSLTPLSVHAASREDHLRLQALLKSAPISLEERSLSEGVFRTGVAVLIPRLHLQTVAPSSTPVYVEFLKDLGAHSIIIVALRMHGGSLGVLSLVRSLPESPPFDEQDRELAQLLADHAALAITNSRLITLRKIAEARFERLSDAGVIGIVVSDLTGRVREINDTLLRMVGYTREEVLGGGISWSSLTPPGSEQMDERAREQLLRTGVSDLREKEYIHKNGTRIPVMIGATMGVEGDGHVIAFVLDLTDRKRAEEATRLEQARFRALVENSADGIALSTGDGTFLYVSPAAARMLGRPASEVIGTNFRDYVHPDDVSIALDQRRRLLEGRQASPTVRRLLRPDGSVRWVEVTATNRIDDPAIGAIVGNIRDITERKLADEALLVSEKAKVNLEAQLRQAQKMEAVGRLAGGVAHDFNNLLSVILSYGQIHVDEMPEGDPGRPDVEEMLKAGQRAADLTRQLLMFSRQQVIEPKVVDLNRLLQNVDKMLQRILGEDIDLVSLTKNPVGGVLVDPSSMEQVVMNLVINARDAMPTGGMLTIETENVVLDEAYAREHMGVTPGRYVMLAVTDTGVGMDRATQTRIFEPFFTTKEKGKGTGLGLSTVFGIITQSRGSVWVYSEPERGTTFKIYLPRVDGAFDEAAPPSDPASARGAETILLVEDEEQVRAVAHTILGRGGYHVLEARDAIDALSIGETYAGDIHLLLTDVVMPEMSGAELAMRLRGTRPDLAVLCMSGYTDDSIVRHGVLVADFAFLQKPITPEALTRKVRDVLDARRLADARA